MSATEYPPSMQGACARCGKVRVTNETRGQKLCSACRYFAADQPPGDWARRGACIGADPDLFDGDRYAKRYDEAIAICSTCPVIDECLNYAIDSNINHGVWGGLTAYQRRQLTCAS